MGDVIAWSKLKKLTKLTKKTIDDVSADVDALVAEGQRSGVPAPNMKVFSAASKTDGIELTYDANVGTSLDGRTPTGDYDYTLASLTKGVMIRYSTSKYPQSINDGLLLLDDKDLFSVSMNGSLVPKSKTKLIDNLPLDNQYYFTAFPYTDYGVVNDYVNELNTTTCLYTTKGSINVDVKADVLTKPLSFTINITNSSGEVVSQKGSKQGIYTFNFLVAGEYTVSVSTCNGYNTPVNQQISVTAGKNTQIEMIYTNNTTFDSASWSDVSAVIESNKATQLFRVGDTKQIDLSSGETITLQIYDFNHDELAVGSGRAAITIGLKDLMKTPMRIHSVNTNAGGFANTELYGKLNEEIFNSLPADLKPLIKLVKKKTSEGDKSSKIRTDNMKLFLFSESEVGITNGNSTGGEGNAYPLFTTNQSRIKKLNSTAYSWSLRSPVNYATNRYCTVYEDGSYAASFATSSNGICYGFCI